MRRLNRNMEQEAIVVRIITLVTLVYLPATFVSTLFSTDIIKYQEDNYPNGKYSQLAMDRWLQVTIPLTAITLFAAWCANGWATKNAALAVEGNLVRSIEENVEETTEGGVGGGVEQSPLLRGNRIVKWLRARGACRARITAGSPLWNADGSKGSAGPFP